MLGLGESGGNFRFVLTTMRAKTVQAKQFRLWLASKDVLGLPQRRNFPPRARPMSRRLRPERCLRAAT